MAKMLGHTTLTMLMTRYSRYVPTLVRAGWALPVKRLEAPGKPVAKRWQPDGGLANRPVGVG